MDKAKEYVIKLVDNDENKDAVLEVCSDLAYTNTFGDAAKYFPHFYYATTSNTMLASIFLTME